MKLSCSTASFWSAITALDPSSNAPAITIAFFICELSVSLRHPDNTAVPPLAARGVSFRYNPAIVVYSRRQGPKARWSSSRFRLLFEHDLFGKPLHTFPDHALVQRRVARTVGAGLVLHKDLGDLRMPDRLAGIIRQQILLGDIGDVFGLGIFREQVIERLVLVWSHLFRNRQPPLLGVVEL